MAQSLSSAAEEGVFLDLMREAIAGTDGTESEALAMFELQLLDRNDARLVWDLFEPVRLSVLRRLYGMANHQIDQVSEAQPSSAQSIPKTLDGTVSEPDVTADSSATNQPTHPTLQHSVVTPIARHVATRRKGHSPRSARSAQDVLISIGGRKSHLDLVTNHRGRPIGDLTYPGLANAADEAPIFQRYARRLMDSGIPKSGRATDIVRRFITPDEADRMWLDLFKEDVA